MDIIDEKREEFGPKLQEFAALRDKSDRLLVSPDRAGSDEKHWIFLRNRRSLERSIASHF